MTLKDFVYGERAEVGGCLTLCHGDTLFDALAQRVEPGVWHITEVVPLTGRDADLCNRVTIARNGRQHAIYEWLDE